MFIILPSDINGIDTLVEKLESNALKNEVWHMDELETHVVIPKFKFDTSVNLNDITKAVSSYKIVLNMTIFNLKNKIKSIFSLESQKSLKILLLSHY